MVKRAVHIPRCGSVACLVLAVCFGAASRLHAQSVLDTKPGMMGTESHPPGWWPKDGSAARDAYTGPEACAACHKPEFEGWKSSQMAHAIHPAAKSAFLLARPHMKYQWGRYSYRIDDTGNQAIYSVTDGKTTLTIPLLWAYGTGVVGQAFIFRIEQTYYEAEVAYYPVFNGLAVVAGLSRTPPPTLQRAFGLPLSADAAQQCIACHTTAAVTENQLQVNSMILGVTCEACHGPGARHVAAMHSLAHGAKPAATYIYDPANLAPGDMENFCGACHRTSLRVIREGLHGLDTVHYEPYRLEMSQCWIMSQQITCITCHNPHQPLERNPTAYDADCLSCHSGHSGATAKVDSSASMAQGKTCPVATKNCVTCHMPKCRLPLSPFTMSDHFIRVVRSGDACAKT